MGNQRLLFRIIATLEQAISNSARCEQWVSRKLLQLATGSRISSEELTAAPKIAKPVLRKYSKLVERATLSSSTNRSSQKNHFESTFRSLVEAPTQQS